MTSPMVELVPDVDRFSEAPDLLATRMADAVPAVSAQIVAARDAGDGDALIELQSRLAAVDAYLQARRVDRGPVMLLERECEVAIGQLLGPAEHGGDRRSDKSKSKSPGDFDFPELHDRLRNEFRLMARWADRLRDEVGLAEPRAHLVTMARRWEREHTPAKADATLNDQTLDKITLLHGDFRDRLTALEPGTVDLILTDPPYPKDDLPLWSDLAELAAKLLAPRGFLVAYTGAIFLPEVIRRLDEHLTYGWTFALILPGQNSRIMGRHLIQSWKPVLIYTVGTWPSGEWQTDSVVSTRPEKGYEWQQNQGAARDLIDRFSPPDGLIVDPFLGVGTFGAAAKDAGRRFVGVELDAGRYTRAVTRIEP